MRPEYCRLDKAKKYSWGGTRLKKQAQTATTENPLLITHTMACEKGVKIQNQNLKINRNDY